MKPRVSILLPNLNNRPFLDERLQTILAQTFSDWELIVVDNYSDDGAWEFFQDMAAKDPRLHISRAPRQGMYANWNNCLRLAKGDYIYIATSDDTMTPQFLDIMVKALDDHPACDLAHCKLTIIDESGAPHPGIAWERFFCALFFGQLIDQPHIRLAPHDGLLHCGVKTVYTSITQLLIRRSLFERIGLFLTDYGSIADFEWGMRASLLADTIHIPQYLATWRVHRSQGSNLDFFKSPQYRTQLLKLVDRAFNRARKIDPTRLKGIKKKDLKYYYLKEKFFIEIKELEQKGLSGPGKYKTVIKWLFSHPRILSEYLQHRQAAKSRHTNKVFTTPWEALNFSRNLLARYGLEKNIEVIDQPVSPVEPDIAVAPEEKPDIETIEIDHPKVAEFREKAPWLFDDPPPLIIEKTHPPILIYQMGKVGSTSIDFTLRRCDLPNPIYHIHQLTANGIDWNIRHYRDLLIKNSPDIIRDDHTRVYNHLYFKYVLRQYRSSHALRQKIEENRDDIPWKIITLVRDPIMREISDFFFSFHRHPGLVGKKGQGLNAHALRILPGELADRLDNPHSWVLTWFDEEFQKVFGIDVYAFPFDHESGYTIIESGNISLLIIQLESLSRCFTPAMSRFLDLPGLELINQNTARQKSYYDTYQYILQHLTLDPQLCRYVYQSKLAAHFYTPGQIRDFTQKWTRPPGNGARQSVGGAQ